MNTTTITAPALTVHTLYAGAGTWATAQARYAQLRKAALGLTAQISDAFNDPEATPANPTLAAHYPFEEHEAHQLNRAVDEVSTLARGHLAAWAKDNEVPTRKVLTTKHVPARDKAATFVALFCGKTPAGFDTPLPEALRVLPGRAGAPEYHPEATPNTYQAIIIEALNHELAKEPTHA